MKHCGGPQNPNIALSFEFTQVKGVDIEETVQD